MNQKTRDLLQLYDNTLTAQGIHRSECENTSPSEDRRLSHARWLIDDLLVNADKEPVYSELEVGRQLGFIQAIIWSSNLIGLDALWDQSRNLIEQAANSA